MLLLTRDTWSIIFSESPDVTDEQPWILPFEDIVTAITLEVGDIIAESGTAAHHFQAVKTLIYQKLEKFYRPECMWTFDSVGGVMAEQVLNKICSR